MSTSRWRALSVSLIVVGVVACLIESLLGRSRAPGAALSGLYTLVMLLTLGSMILSLVRMRPWARPAWVALTVVLSLSFAGVSYRQFVLGGVRSIDLSSPTPVDALYAAIYGVTLISLVYMIRRVKRRAEPMWFLDAAITFVGVAAVGSQIILVTMYARNGADWAFWLQTFYLLVNAGLIALAIRLWLATSRVANRGLRIGLAALVIFVLNDVVSTAMIINRVETGVRDGIYIGINLLAIAMIAASICDPTSVNAPAATPHESRLSTLRTVVPTVLVVVLVGVIVVSWPGLPTSGWVVRTASAATLTLLLAARSAALVGAYRQTLRREEVLRVSGVAINHAESDEEIDQQFARGLARLLPEDRPTFSWRPAASVPAPDPGARPAPSALAPDPGAAPEGDVPVPVPVGNVEYLAVERAGEETLTVALSTPLMLDPLDWTAVESLADVAAAARLREHLRAERESAAEIARASMLMAGSQDMVVLLDPDGRIKMAAGAVGLLTSHSADHWHRRGLDELFADSAIVESLVRQSSPGRARVQAEIVGREVKVEVTVERSADGEVSVALHDVTERVRLADELEYSASHDALTGLPNRANLAALLADAELSWRQRGERFGVAFIDIDDFKMVNDSLGHPFGDQLLIGLGERFAMAAGQRGTVVRLGGDEFAVVMRPTNPEDAMTVAQSLLDSLRTPVVVEGVEIVVRASCGVAVVDVEQSTGDLLLQAADLALYNARERGKGGIALYQAELKEVAVRRLAEATAVTEAARNQQFRFDFQPVIDVPRNHVVAVEALMRWDAGGAYATPDAFIPVAESLGELTRIMTTLLPSALAQVAAMREVQADLKVAFNMHAAAMVDGDFEGWLTQAVAAAGLPNSAIIIEVSERSLMPAQASGHLTRLRDAGMAVWIDDFGTGWSNLSYLEQLPVTGVKLARELVFDRDGNAKRDLVRAVVSLSDAMGFTVVAEGVETTEQGQSLTELGVDLVQGYLLARPMPRDELVSWLGQRVG
ncbi:MAG TPA: EAL domain-containing protein [Actinomycetota bacterium]|nr:EAL domain-containing protein [Actinomycetota bacterium]